MPATGEVLVRGLAADIKNTAIDTRFGFYSSSLTGRTEDLSTAQWDNRRQNADGNWNHADPFPTIQEADSCARVVAYGPGGEDTLLSRCVLISA